MDKRHKKHSNNWNNQNNQRRVEQNTKDNFNKKVFQFDKSQYDDLQSEKDKQNAIAEIKSREIICPICNQPITDIASALSDKNTGKPIHFDCALEKVKNGETLSENEKVAYIGQGRFAVLYYENIRDQRNFNIKKIIEWENREEQIEWRNELSELYSKVK